jgi:hypothetical protein
LKQTSIALLRVPDERYSVNAFSNIAFRSKYRPLKKKQLKQLKKKEKKHTCVTHDVRLGMEGEQHHLVIHLVTHRESSQTHKQNHTQHNPSPT